MRASIGIWLTSLLINSVAYECPSIILVPSIWLQLSWYLAFASLYRVNPFRLIGVGLSVWVFATAGCGFSVGFWSITTFRMWVCNFVHSISLTVSLPAVYNLYLVKPSSDLCKCCQFVECHACGRFVWCLNFAGRLVGVGEASFVSLAAPFILDVAPPSQVKWCLWK